MQTEYHKSEQDKSPKPPGIRVRAEVAPRVSVSARVEPPLGRLGLSAEHSKYLLERGVTAGVARAAGYFTVSSPKEHPDVFSERQRRRSPSLIAPHTSPDGETVGFQKRDDRPGKDRRGKLLKWVSPPAERARPVLSVHPWMLGEVTEGAGPLWVVEGLTRGHALAGLGIPAVSYAGCYSWQKGGEPLECWRHLNLRGRLVYDVPDADARTNDQVQQAQAERVAYMEERGARVLVVSVPEVEGDEHTGLDDYIAAGGDPRDLAARAKPYQRVDVGRGRLAKDERLRIFVARKRRQVDELPARKVGECGAVKVARYMVETSAPAHGKVRADGVVVHPSVRQIASGVRMGVNAVRNALTRLEGEGFLKTPYEPRARHEAASYLLLDPSGGGSALSEHIGTSGVGGKESEECRGEEEVSLYKRDSYTRVHSVHIGVKSEKEAERLPALRNSKLVHTFERKNGRRVVVHSDYFKRYGAKGEEVLRYILEHGRVGVSELLGKFGSKTARRGRFYKTWVEPMVDDGVIVGDTGGVEPAPDWPEALERVRDRTDERLDNRLQDRKIADQQKAFRQAKDLGPTDPTPELVGPERVADIVAKAKERDYEARVEEQRSKVGMTAEVFLADALQDASGFGWRELRALWIAKGGRAEDLRRAVKNPYQFRREHDDGPLYIVRMEAVPEPEREPEREPAPVAVLREPVEDWRSHPLDCECDECLSPMPVKYAKAWSGA